MNEIKQLLINQAREQYDNVLPCSQARDLGECFTVEGNLVCFWFNTEDHSTHLVSAEFA